MVKEIEAFELNKTWEVIELYAQIGKFCLVNVFTRSNNFHMVMW